MRSFPIVDDSVIAKSISAVPPDHLPVVEMFYGIEGEGSNIGDMRILLRVGGCRVKCSGCDSVHTWNANQNSRVYALPDLLKELEDLIDLHDVKTVAVTGGEPMHYPQQMIALAVFLRRKKVRSWLETSGWITDEEVFSHFDFLSFDLKTPSSGEACMTPDQIAEVHTAVSNHLLIRKRQAHVKMIVTNQADVNWILLLRLHELFYRDALKKQMEGRLIVTPACGKHSSVSQIRERMEMCMNELKGLPYRIIAQQHPLLSMR